MTTLRDKQRERRRSDIMDAAWALISEKGLDNTSIEDIAARAEVGTATVYNYFGTKSDLLQALFVRYIEEEVQRGAVALQNPPERIADGMLALFERYLDGMATHCSPTLLREFYVLSMSQQLGYGRQAYELKQRFLEQVLSLASHYKERGQIRDDVTAAEAAVMCYSSVTLPFALFSLGMGIDVETARHQIRRYVTLAVSGVGSRTTPGGKTQHNV
jgi:AcrR family transcriptional regulator